MRELNKFQLFVFNAGGVIMLISALGFLFVPAVFSYTYIIGSLMFASMQMLMSYEGNSFVIRRLRRQQLFGDFMLMLAGPMMILNHTEVMGYYLRNEWMLALLIGALLQLYTSFRIPSELKKEK